MVNASEGVKEHKMFVAVEEISKTNVQPQSALAGPEAKQLLPKTEVRATESVRSTRPELNISGSQLLVGFTSVCGAVGLLLWAILRVWLFEQWRLKPEPSSPKSTTRIHWLSVRRCDVVQGIRRTRTSA